MCGESKRFQFQRFPRFGNELRRSFPVHEYCYDCAAFYDDCPAWPANREWQCRHHQRLPDVMPGTYGQEFPNKVFVPTDPIGERQPGQQPSTVGAKPERRSRAARRLARARSPRVSATEFTKRLCQCGMPLRKRRRFCDACRDRRKREALSRFVERRKKDRQESLRQPTEAA